MLSPNDLEILTEIGAILRPEWDPDALYAGLRDEHAHRDMRDVATTMVWLSAQPGSLSLNAMLSAPSWEVRADVMHGVEMLPNNAVRCPLPGHTSYLESNCGACRADRLAAS
jgi:hypothetical protein